MKASAFAGRLPGQCSWMLLLLMVLQCYMLPYSCLLSELSTVAVDEHLNDAHHHVTNQRC
jgi:hypothetical protein